jgi:hypothetical protein
MDPRAPIERRELAVRKHGLHHACRRIAPFAILIPMRPRVIPGLALLGVLTLGVAARADEFRLKDGTKISGTIVGYESDSFKVETPYGFALVRKDKIAEIIPSAPKKESDPKAKSTAPATPSPEPAAPASASGAKASSTPANATSTLSAPPTRHTLSTGIFPDLSEKKDASTAKEKNAAAVAPTPPTPPPTPPPPPPSPEPVAIRDETRGNLYVNYTFGFQMYKPPSWDLIPAARKALPDAVAAMGTSDETTLLVIGREQGKASLETHTAATEKTLREIYENYRAISSRSTSLAGVPALERRFRGTVDGRDWSVILMEFQRGTDIFTLLGMTWATSDLIQMQENVISRAVNSIAFATP